LNIITLIVYINGYINCINGNHTEKLVANVFHNEWWKCRHVTWLHVCTLYISCNIIIASMTHYNNSKVIDTCNYNVITEKVKHGWLHMYVWCV
jgi:hypothetical protein